MKKIILTGLIAFSVMPAVMAEDLYSQLRLVDPVMQNVLNLSPAEPPKRVSISYDSPFALYNLAFERFKHSNVKPAYDDIKNLIENADAGDYFYIKVADNLAKAGLYSLSELAMNKIKEKDISNIVVEDIKHYYFPAKSIKQKKELYLGEIYSNIVYNDQMAEAFEELSNFNDTSGEGEDYVNYLKAFALVRSKDFTRAQEFIKKAVELNPDNINYQALEVEILAETNNPKEALKIINKLKKQQIYSVTYTEKINSLDEYVQYKLAKKDTVKNYHLGYYYYWEKAYEKSIRTLSGINKKDAKILSLLSRVYFDNKEYDKAYGFAMKSKNLALSNEVLGDYFVESEDYHKAVKSYSKAVKLDEKQLRYKEKLAQCYFELDEYSKAKELFEQVIMTSSNAYISYYNLAKLDSTKELPYLKKSVAINMMFTDSWLALADCEMRKQNFQGADKYLKIVKSIDENNFKYYYYLGLLLDKQGQSEQAKQNYQKSLLLKPDFRPAKEALNI